MASQLEKLISTVRAIGQGAKKTGSDITAFDKVFSKHVDTVKATIGGGARRADQEVIEALENARRATQQAAVALDNAARACEKYASSI